MFSSLLSTDAHYLVIKLDGQCDMVDFVLSKASMVLADILVKIAIGRQYHRECHCAQ